MTKFLNDNKLAVNIKKTTLTEIMVKQKRGKIGGSLPSLEVEISPGTTKVIHNKDYTRILGANLQGNLGWNRHLETGEKALFPQTRKQLGHLKYLGKLIPKSSRLNLARGLVLSHLNYMMPLWGGAGLTYINKAQTLLNSTARWCTGLPKRTKTSTLMERTGWLSIR